MIKIMTAAERATAHLPAKVSAFIQEVLIPGMRDGTLSVNIEKPQPLLKLVEEASFEAGQHIPVKIKVNASVKDLLAKKDELSLKIRETFSADLPGFGLLDLSLQKPSGNDTISIYFGATELDGSHKLLEPIQAELARSGGNKR